MRFKKVLGRKSEIGQRVRREKSLILRPTTITERGLNIQLMIRHFQDTRQLHT